MITFWIIAAVMLLAALGMLAPALLRKRELAADDRNQQNVAIARERISELEAEHAAGRLDDAAFEQTKQELEQALLLDIEGDEPVRPEAVPAAGKMAMGGVALLVPLLTIGVYFYLGEPALIGKTNDELRSAPAQSEGQPQMSMEEAIARLEEKLNEQPENPEGWFMLGRTRMALKEYPKAVAAFEKAYAQMPEEPAVMLALADALTMLHQGELTGRPAELVEKALEQAPADPTALWLGGMVANAQGNPELALQRWDQLRPLLADQPESIQQLDQMVAGVRADLGLPPAERKAPEPPAAGASIRVKVDVAAELKDQFGPDETLFIFARAVNGPRFPLAVVRKTASDLPIEVTLDDSMAMQAGAALSSFPQVKVSARISRSGNAIAASGDLIGETEPLAVADTEQVEVVIDSRVE